MTAENIILKATEVLRPPRNEVGNFFLFEGEVKTALNSIFWKILCGSKLFETS